MKLPGYHIVGELLRTEHHVIHRARRETDGAAVLVKGPRRPPGRSAELRRELALRRRLDVPGVLAAHELVRQGDESWLVLDDKGGVPLGAGPLDLATFLHLALQASAILGELHRRDVIHRNLQPASLLVHPVTRELWLDGLEPGALAYSSPEQTGRINRTIDYRTDFYSLGVTFYELLCGRRPFTATEPLELIHAHIAIVPTPPSEIAPAVPQAVSAIVMKLLEKTAEMRYQSTAGLRADLEICAREWSARRQVLPFVLGAHDVSDRLLIPQRLYGRDDEVARLMESFERVRQGPSALTLVSGYSGVGKTSLIQELYRPIVRQRGAFLAGKFDLVARNVPYGALLQAFHGLVQKLIAEPEERIATWRARLLEALAGNGAVLTEVIPEIALLIGEQPPVPPLGPAEAQNRFRLVFQSFVGALARADHPLVVFLDDLQWADAASLALLVALLTSPELRHLCLVGAYRDNEIGADHPLARTIAALEAAGARVDRIVLLPLALPVLERLVGDCLRRHDGDVDALARLVAAKTEGNPFFVIQFLKSLWQEGLLRFDVDQGRWTFTTGDIARAPMTGNVIDLMSRKIQRLSERTQSVLTLAACVGNPFDVPTLALVSQQSPEETEPLLREAADEGLVVQAGERGGYAFLHDRVQQAAYARLPEGDRQSVHLTVGRLLLSRWDPAAADERIFDVVGHLNLGSALINDAAERRSLTRLNLVAGKRAKSQAAYQAALGYFTAGRDLVTEPSWGSDYALAFELHREAAECESLCGRFDEAERRFEELLVRARTAVDRAQVYDLRVVQCENQSRYADGARIGTEGLRLLGFTFPDDEEGKRAALDEENRTIARLLGDRTIESLVDLPIMGDAATCMVMRLLTDIWAPAYIAGDAVLVSLVSARMVSLSIQHGNTEDSAYGYVTHAISVGPSRGDYRSAYEWGTLALKVNERFGDRKRRAKVHQQFNAHVTLWRRPLETCAVHAREAWRSGLQNGDFTYAGYGAFTESWPAFLTSRDLARFVQELQPNLALLERIHTHGLAAAHGLMLNWARALAGQTEGPLSLTDAGWNETGFARTYADNPFFMTIFQIAKLHLAFLHEDLPAALAATAEARRLSWGHGTIWPVLLTFWGGLAEAARATAGRQSPELLAAGQSLRVLADHCPENFRCHSLIIDGEIARIEGRFTDSLDAFDDAIRYARQIESLQHEALAQELAGRLWLARGNETVAAAYLGEARRRYREWGAHAKVAALDERHPRLGLSQKAAAPSLDVATVTKAAHALSVDIVLEELVRTLVRIAVENAGAERGLFLGEEDGRLVALAEGGVHAESVALLGSLPLESSTTMARAVVQYVRKTGASLVLGDAAADERFAGDPYIASARPKSILCVPVVQQGKLGGILYLENNLTTHAFTAERIKVLDVLAAQAAIALENARLYRDKSAEVERRKRAEEELRAALTQVESLKNRLEAENVYLKEEIRNEHNFEEMVGTSPALLAVLRTVERIAPTDSTVLIGGETGTGKELIARAIHDRGRRRDRPLVKVNCAAIAAGLVESELFGHVKGAFTGALERRVGRFELAHGGTIFLDEIGEVPLETQVKLLRVLQEQEFEPVGSSRTVRIDVRIIAATNRDLDEAVRSGRFRSDLFYRLNVLPVTVPPLRERRSDIPQLVAFFLARFSRRFQRAVTAVSRETLELLVNYPWPGNIRELQNVIERAVVLTQGATLALDHDLRAASVVASRPEPAAPAADGHSLQEVERRHILEVLSRTRGVIEGPAGAAQILKLHPNTLRSRMKKLGIGRTSHEIS